MGGTCDVMCVPAMCVPAMKTQQCAVAPAAVRIAAEGGCRAVRALPAVAPGREQMLWLPPVLAGISAQRADPREC